MALPLLNYPMTAVHQPSLPPQSSGTKSESPPEHYLSYLDNLVYHYLGGILLAMMKKWLQAEEFFEICATSPTQGPSTISALQLEAFKKLVLVQLISHGKVGL